MVENGSGDGFGKNKPGRGRTAGGRKTLVLQRGQAARIAGPVRASGRVGTDPGAASKKNRHMAARKKEEVSGAVRNWLWLGVAMVFVQVVVGGVTRLTDSGLSITEWAVIQGTLPPADEAAWEEAFGLYRQAARKQYESIHADMTMAEFKVIYFWEYGHRLWARSVAQSLFLLKMQSFCVSKPISLSSGPCLAL